MFLFLKRKPVLTKTGKLRKINRRMLRYKNRMLKLTEKNEKPPQYKENMYYRLDKTIENEKNIIETYKSLMEDKSDENKFLNKWFSHIKILIDRKIELDYLLFMSSGKVKAYSGRLEKGKDELLKEAMLAAPKLHDENMKHKKLIKKLKLIRDKFDREVPEKIEALRQAKYYRDEIKFALSHRKVFYTELETYAKVYTQTLAQMEIPMCRQLIDVYDKIPEHFIAINVNEQKMLDLLKIHRKKVKHNKWFCSLQYDEKHFQSLKFKRRPRRPNLENPLSALLQQIFDTEIYIWKRVKIVSYIKRELFIHTKDLPQMTKAIDHAICANGELFYVLIFLRTLVESEIHRIDVTKQKRQQILEDILKKNLIDQRYITELESDNNILSTKLRNLNMKINANRALYSLFAMYFSKLFDLIGITHDESALLKCHVTEATLSNMDFLTVNFEEQIYFLLCRLYYMEYIDPTQQPATTIQLFRRDPQLTPLQIVKKGKADLSELRSMRLEFCGPCLQVLAEKTLEEKKKALTTKDTVERKRDPTQWQKWPPNLYAFIVDVMKNVDSRKFMHNPDECENPEAIKIKKRIYYEHKDLLKERRPPF